MNACTPEIENRVPHRKFRTEKAATTSYGSRQESGQFSPLTHICMRMSKAREHTMKSDKHMSHTLTLTQICN